LFTLATGAGSDRISVEEGMADIEHVAEVEDLDSLLERSRERPVWIFKHSVTCGISAGARRRYAAYAAEQADGDAVFTLLEVQHARPLSKAIAEATGVLHHSPQLILLRDGRAVWNTSHGRITADAMAEAVAG
jgi:bacillithiol system protein YtxJ